MSSITRRCSGLTDDVALDMGLFPVHRLVSTSTPSQQESIPWPIPFSPVVNGFVQSPRLRVCVGRFKFHQRYTARYILGPRVHQNDPYCGNQQFEIGPERLFAVVQIVVPHAAKKTRSSAT